MTEFRSELVADINLRRAGLTVWLPQHEVRWKNGQLRIAPMFPGYLFFQADMTMDLWRKAYATRGVRGLMQHAPERPTPVPQKALDILWERCAPNGVIYPRQVSSFRFDGVQKDDEVEMLDGPFTAFRGVCLMSAKDRVRLLLTVFGRKVEVDVRHADVRVVAEPI